MNKVVLIANDTYENYEDLSGNIPIEIECINKTFEKIGYEVSLLYNRPFSNLYNELHSTIVSGIKCT